MSNHRLLILDIMAIIVFYLTQAEGLITGTMAMMFTIAGPVIVSGTVASAGYGPAPLPAGYGG